MTGKLGHTETEHFRRFTKRRVTLTLLIEIPLPLKMKRISLCCPFNGIIPFISCSAISTRAYSSLNSNKSISVKGKPGLNINFETVKCLNDAVALFHQMVRMQPLPSLLVFCQLFKTILNMKHYSDVISLFREIQNLGVPINVFILISVINSYCLMHNSDCAFSVLLIFLKNDIPFDVVIFTALIRGLFAENKVKDAVELFKKLVRENSC
ncbi:putative pentatricopeptide repeat-containing protein At1g12700, mitochondrial [Lycium barbarum]|uniref:putative pentatricopeptide repeat-containing protein At1g12700, mitochondrial n=1 Tax=Lycium barbarum TaxID=112863 RepID=UPI00293F3AAF|nr:putative pentatricopeptide repeat-containing protein At1g12700, mitochondrial [Lycium barbarum]